MSARFLRVALVGSPNVGKSSLFNALTKSYVTVSNYPGTTIDITRGMLKIKEKQYEFIDTPGAYSLMPITEEEKVTRELLFTTNPDIVLHIIDAKSIRRMLPMTLELIDGGFPVVLVLNIIDEAKNLGIRFDIPLLQNLLGIPVLCTSVHKNLGFMELRETIFHYEYHNAEIFRFSGQFEDMITNISKQLSGEYGPSKRLMTLLLMKNDELTKKNIVHEPQYQNIVEYINTISVSFTDNMDYLLAVERQKMIEAIVEQIVHYAKKKESSFREMLGRWTREPLTGIPILLLVLYFGFYLFVGRFGAGYLVDYLDSNVFLQYINPLVKAVVNSYISVDWVKSIIVGEYGIFTMGFRYAAAIILPIVGTFFLMFSFLEDCGYLPRLAMLVDRVCKQFGLNGRFIIPLTLGLGCGTMAVLVTRTLETKRERLLATFLIAMAVPCSAQLGLVLALLSYNKRALIIWMLVLVAVFLWSGFTSAKLLKGERSAFYMELPPLRFPVLSNMLMKSYTRMTWYFMEILPVFIITSIVMWAGDNFGLLRKIIVSIGPATKLLGLPVETAQTFILGFFRRDYGAAGLYDMFQQGQLTDHQLLVAAVTLTLFVPCVAQMAVMVKERGILNSIVMVLIICLNAFIVGVLINKLLIVFPYLLS